METALRPLWWAAGAEWHSPPSSSSLAGGILVLSAGFVLFSTVVFLGDLEIYFLVPISGHCGSRQDGWTGGPGRQKGGQGRQRGGGRRARKHASHYYVHGPVAGQGTLELKKSKAAPPKMWRLLRHLIWWCRFSWRIETDACCTLRLSIFLQLPPNPKLPITTGLSLSQPLPLIVPTIIIIVSTIIIIFPTIIINVDKLFFIRKCKLVESS